MAEQVEVADRVQHLVLDELVVVAQALAVQHAEVVEHDRVLQAAAEPEPGGAHRLDVLHEAERARARDFLDVRVLGEVDDDLPVLRAEHRMREVDREVELEAVERLEARPLVAVAHLDRREDAQVVLRARPARRCPPTAAGTRTAPALPSMIGISGPATSTCRLSMPRPAQRRHQVLDGRDRRAVLLERRRQARVADVQRVRGNRDRLRQIDAMEHDAGVGRRRTQHEIDARAGVQADARRLDRRS